MKKGGKENDIAYKNKKLKLPVKFRILTVNENYWRNNEKDIIYINCDI